MKLTYSASAIFAGVLQGSLSEYNSKSEGKKGCRVVSLEGDGRRRGFRSTLEEGRWVAGLA